MRLDIDDSSLWAQTENFAEIRLIDGSGNEYLLRRIIPFIKEVNAPQDGDTTGELS